MTQQLEAPSLESILSPLTGHQRKFMLYRIADIDAAQARVLCGVKQGEYNHWFDAESPFTLINQRRVELTQTFRKEAIRLLRKDNQIAAILLEAKMIETMTRELESRNYDLVKTALAKDVYAKLVTDLDVSAPPVSPWQARIQNLFVGTGAPVPEVTVVTNEQLPETNSSQTTEYQEGEFLPQSEQGSPSGEEEVSPA